jgi:hypothetical protein
LAHLKNAICKNPVLTRYYFEIGQPSAMKFAMTQKRLKTGGLAHEETGKMGATLPQSRV